MTPAARAQLAGAAPAGTAPPPSAALAPGTIPGATPGAVPGTMAASPPRNIYTFLCPTPEQKTACQAKICNSVFGQLLNNSLKPASALSGGLVPQICQRCHRG